MRCLVCEQSVSERVCTCQLPKLSAHSLEDSNAELYSEISELDLSHPFQSVEDLERRAESDARLIRHHLKNKKDDIKALEIGPGLGHLGRILQKDFDYYAADLVPNYLSELALQPGKSLLWDVSSGGVRGEFDLIVACDVFEHVLNEGDAWLSVFEALKPGGIFYIRVPYKEPLVNYSRLLGAPYPYVHLRSYSLGYLREMSQYAGFTISRIRRTYNHQAPYSRRSFALPFLRRRHSSNLVSDLRLGYSGMGIRPGNSNSESFMARTPLSRSLSVFGVLKLIFDRLGPRLQSFSRALFKTLQKFTANIFFRPSEVAIVLEKKTRQ